MNARRHVSVQLLAIIAVAVIGVALLHLSHAAQTSIVVPAAASSTPAVPIPTSGFYWGGINTTDMNAYGCSQADDYIRLQCKITAVGDQTAGLKGTFPKQADGYFHTSLSRVYLNGDYGCQDVARLKTGDIYKEATTESGTGGRKVITLSTKCGPWTKLANGGGTAAEDKDIKALVDAMNKLPVDFIFVFHHEPDNDACGGGFGTPDDYRRAFRQFAADVRTEQNANGKNNIAIGQILTKAPYANDRSQYVFTGCGNLHPAGTTAFNNSYERDNWENWWPGDDAVDWVGSDEYTNGTDHSYATVTLNNVLEASERPCPSTHPAIDYNCTSARQDKPIVIGEVGVGSPGGSNPTTPTPTQKGNWFDQMHADAQNYAAYPLLRKIKAISYWSSGKQNVIDPDTADNAAHPGLIAYAKMTLDPAFRNPIFGDTGGGGSDTTNPTVRFSAAPDSPAAGTIAITANATDDVGVTKVQLLVDNAVVATDTTSPYTFSWNTTSVANGTHTLQFYGYDAAGNIGKSGKVTLTVDNSPATYLPADINKDGAVDYLDLSILATNFGKSGSAIANPRTDINGDGIVNYLDLSILATSYTPAD